MGKGFDKSIYDPTKTFDTNHQEGIGDGLPQSSGVISYGYRETNCYEAPTLEFERQNDGTLRPLGHAAVEHATEE